MTTELIETSQENPKKNGFHQNGFAQGHIANDQKFMNGDCNKTQFRDQVRKMLPLSSSASP